MSDTTASGSIAESADPPLWVPSPERVTTSQLDRFRREARPDAADSDELWRWSVDDSGDFWASIWDWCEVVGDRGERLVDDGDSFWTTTFLPDATLNVAENLLADRPGSGEVAVIAVDEAESDSEGRAVSRQELRDEVAAMAAAFRAAGVEPGDRVAAWMPHRVETIVAFLAAASIGAVFTSTSADFGVAGVLDRFGQTEPKVLVAADGYHYGGKSFPMLDRLNEIVGELPSLELVVVVGVLEHRPLIDSRFHHWSDLVTANEGAEPDYTALPVNHPLYILYSSGTTGKPKCIVHRSGGVLLKHLSEQRLHCDITPGDTVFYFTTCGWMMWNWLVSCLASGATIMLYDGNPAHPEPGRLFDLVERYGITLFGISAKYIDSLMKIGYVPAAHHELSSIKTVCSTGSPLSHEAFRWIYRSINPRLHLASISGGTDLCGCLVLGDPTKPVYAGEIQARALGVAVDVFDDDGRTLGPGSKGELVCTQPFPSMPLEFWNDPGHTRYRRAYFERFNAPDRPPVWAHGDFAAWTGHRGMIIFGRSDATLNASGVRIGTAEIYRIVEQLPEVVEAVAVAQEWDNDTRIVLFVHLIDDATLTSELEGRIRTSLRIKASPRHVPAVIAAVDDIPRTRSGKIVELAVTEMIHGRPVGNREALANPEALDQFARRPELR